jgi:hypothetical protein
MSPPIPPDPGRPLQTFAAVCSVNPQVRTEHDLGLSHRPVVPGYEIEPCPTRRRPGIIAATHLSRIPNSTLAPREHSFFGYGGTVVEEGVDGRSRVYHGDILVRLFTPPSPSYPNECPPPPPGRTEDARNQLFRIEANPRRPPGLRPHEFPHPGQAAGRFRFNPETPKDNSATRSRDATVGSSPERESATRIDQEMAKTLVSFREAREAAKGDLPEARIDDEQRKTAPVKSDVEKGGEQSWTVIEESDVRDSSSEKSSHSTQADTKGFSQSAAPQSTNHIPVPLERSNDVRGQPDPVDVVMAPTDDESDEDSSGSDSSPPELLYIDTDDELPLETSVSTDRSQPTSSLSSMATRLPTPSFVTARSLPRPDAPKVTTKVKCIDYGEWKGKLQEVEKKLNDGEKWTSAAIREIFGEMRMLHWWFSLNFEVAKDGGIDWVAWKEMMVKNWTERYPDVMPLVFRWMADDVERLNEKVQAMRILVTKTTEVTKDNDDEMIIEDAPGTLESSSLSVYLPSPPPDKDDDIGRKTETLAIDESEWEMWKERVEELEERVEETAKDTKKRLAEMEDDLAEEAIDLANLRWRLTEVEETTKKSRPAGRRDYRRSRGRPKHQHNTRFAAAYDDEPVQLTRRDIGDIERRTRKVEERVEGQKREVERLRKELAEVQALTPKISELSASFENFRSNQLKINHVIFQDLTRLRERITDHIDPRIGVLGRDVSNLYARYQSLFTIASNLLSQTTAGRAAQNATMPPPRYSNPNYSTTFLPHRGTVAPPFNLPGFASLPLNPQPPQVPKVIKL